jgi:HlyD family secretion protein/epimerase transport system membrane fusion protein
MSNTFRSRVQGASADPNAGEPAAPASPEPVVTGLSPRTTGPSPTTKAESKAFGDALRTFVNRLRQARRDRATGQKLAPTLAPADRALAGLLAPWGRFGWALIAVFIGGSVVWAGSARLDGAAIASGVVMVETKRKTIQHLEGGIIKDIPVAEGDKVKAGQVLVRFDDTHPKAALDLLRGRLVSALALEARLVAERDGAKEIEFPDEIVKNADDPKVSKVMMGEIDVLKARRSHISGQESVLSERIDKHHREIAGLRAQIASSREQLSLIEEEIQPVEEMVARGVVSKAVLLALKGKKAGITGKIGDLQAQVARAQEGISEVKLQLKMPGSRDHNEVTEQIQKVEGDIADLRDKIHAAEDVLRRTEVVAPRAGTVVDLQVHTVGGVVQPGQTLLDLVPDLDRLIVDVRIDPRDIDVVYPAMPAQVRLTAFNARTTPMLSGTVTSVSADRMIDQVTGIPYFTARVVLDADDIDFDLKRLKAGMQAEVFLVTAERTALDYLIEPLVRRFARAGREQ